jgi:chemotaxis signal transduction protein
MQAFGVTLGGVPVLLEPGLPVEYLVDVEVYPMPRASTGMLGLLQLRGLVCPVFDPAERPRGASELSFRCNVLVIGTGASAGAVCVSQPPQAVECRSKVEQPRPDLAFADCLSEAWEDAADRKRVWWRFQPEVLFERLAGRSESRLV